ncbi:toxic anion resistance protein [Halomonas sp. GXIMD04776]|uniref:toxic anion resistance protein n=1 Tax=Halomonas sp. GXIMD04776 TaxID=3415605 RepID=UPI003CC3EFEA
MSGERDKTQMAGQLRLPPADEIATHLQGEFESRNIQDDEAKLGAEADAFVNDLLSARHVEDGAERQRRAVDEMGSDIQRQAAYRSEMLQTPIRKLAHHGDDGGPVAQALTSLRERMTELDPNRQTLTRGGLDRLLARIPGVGNNLQRYFRKYESAQEALDAIIRDLEDGRDMLRRDNLTLSDDQTALRDILAQLQHQIALGRLVDERLEARMIALEEDDPQRAFIEEELLFPLRQRIVDLQQQLAVSQQGVLALEVVIRNNRELIRGVDRAINVTVSALTVAVTVALALANQRLVLDRVEALNATTSDMIAGTAKSLRNQGVEIQNRSAATMLDMEKLEQAFGDVLAAIDDVSRYRREALPRLDEQIDRLQVLARQGGEAIHRLERGNDASSGDAI